MITIITGNPGAGKTLYTVDKLLRGIVGTTVDEEVDGEIIKHPRTIYSNVNGLLLDHEKIDGSDKGGLRNWHEWAKPGSVIVFDEVQKTWEPRANGSKVPPDIQALETHRHMGVDFILITQGLMLTERNLCMLCNRHLHVRRIGNMPLAIVYEWDHASRTLMYSKAVAKAPYRYSKAVYKLYKSAKLHTSQKRRIPTLVYFILAGLLALAYLAPTTYTRLAERTGLKKAEPAAGASLAADSKKPAQGQGVQPVPVVQPAPALAPEPAFIDDRVAFIPRISGKPETAPAYDQIRRVANMPLVSGGVCMQGKCRCVTQQGTDVGMTHDECKAWLSSPPFDPYTQQVQPAPQAAPKSEEVEASSETATFQPPPPRQPGIVDLQREAVRVASVARH